MMTLFRTETLTEAEQIKEQLRGQLEQLSQRISPLGTPQKIIRYEFPCKDIDILSWLHNQTHDEKIYWSNRDRSFETGAIGSADIIQSQKPTGYETVFEQMQERLSSDNPHLRYYGGFSFSCKTQDDNWKEFGTYRFIIPQFEITKGNGSTTVAFNIALSQINEKTIQQYLGTLNQIDFRTNTQYRNVPKIQKREDTPDRQTWKTLFNVFISQTKQNLLQKLVLARRSIFTFNVSIRPCALIKHLKDVSPHCFHFCFQTSPHTAFLGATPERLFKYEFPLLESEAIAGTTSRGKTKEEDKLLAQKLLNSTKNAKEHQFVVDDLHQSFKVLCVHYDCDKNFSLMQLRGGQHLVTNFKGELKNNKNPGETLRSIHPTPAVGGTPKIKAIEVIEQLEDFNRGWYAGPVGYVGFDKVEFAVAIRSGLVKNNTLSVYAGAGLVEASDADEEWMEIENKISRFMKIFKYGSE